MVREIAEKFSPVWKGQGVIDAYATAKRVAEWSKYFFGDKNQPAHYHINKGVPQFHIDYYRDMFSEYKLTFICAPSGFGKTTIGTLIYPLYRIVYFNEPYIVIASRTRDIAEEYLSEIKSEIQDNEKFIQIYGDLKDTKAGPNNRRLLWNQGYIELLNGSKIRAVGWGGNVRGRKKSAFRITLFIGDDPEELEDVESPKTMMKNKKWLNRSVLKRLDRDYGKVRITGTLIAENCLLGYLGKHKSWLGKTYTAIVKDENGVEKSIWEDQWSIEFLKAERRAAEVNGELEDWYYERMNQPPDNREKKIEGYKLFRGVYKREIGQNFLTIDNQEHPVHIWASVDPAFGSDEHHHDPRALVIFAKGRILMRNSFNEKPFYMNKLWVLEATKSWMSPDAVLDWIMDKHKAYYLEGFIIEAIGGQQIYESFMTKYMQGDQFLAQNPCRAVYPKYQPKNKKSRIYNGLQPKCKLGQIEIADNLEDLKAEFDNFHVIENPNLLDALEFGNRYSYEHLQDAEEVKKTYYSRKKRQRSMPEFKLAPTNLAEIGIN